MGTVMASTIGLPSPYGGWQPDYQVQVPMNTSNTTGIKLADLNREFPQNLIGFSGNLVLYFDPVLPSTQVVVTTVTPSNYWIHPDLAVLAEVPIGPPVEPPPQTPEPGTWLMVAFGFCTIFLGKIRR